MQGCCIKQEFQGNRSFLAIGIFADSHEAERSLVPVQNIFFRVRKAEKEFTADLVQSAIQNDFFIIQNKNRIDQAFQVTHLMSRNDNRLFLVRKRGQ